MDKGGFFQALYEKAKVNCIIIMDAGGTILEVNKSFTNNFGYRNEDISGQNFSILFTEKDKSIRKPQNELNKVLTTGQANDENFVIHQDGSPIWCTGESFSVQSGGEHYIIKDIVNLQTRKQMKLLLTESEELLDTVFNSPVEIPLMVIDGGMRVQKVNSAFKKLFGLNKEIANQAKLSDLQHPFWDTPSLRNELRTLIVSKIPITNSLHVLLTETGETKTISIQSRFVQKGVGTDTKFYIMLEEVLETAD